MSGDRRTEKAGSKLTMANGQQPKIIIADKSPVIRAGLADLIKRDGRFNVVATVATGSIFIDQAVAQKIDIGIIGWSLPDMTGGDVLETLKRRQAATKVIVYTGEQLSDVLQRAIKSGARGFMSKSEDGSALLETVSSVARGRVCFPYIDIENLGRDPLAVLTSRERELLGALANGWSNLQIATRFGISENTVKYHLKNLYDKLAVRNRAMAVALYMGNPPARASSSL